MSRRWFRMSVLMALVCSTAAAAGLPSGVTAQTFKDPPKEYRLVQYQLTRGSLKTYPDWGIGGYMGFFYKSLYEHGPNGAKRIGSLVDAAHKSGSPVWLADDWGYPSGMAGGRVVAENPDFEVRSLVMLSHKGNGAKPIAWELPKNLHDIVCAVLYPVRGGGIDVQAGKRIAARKRDVVAQGIAGDWELRIFARYTRSKNTQAQSTMQQFGHTGRYPDLMNRKAMSRFIHDLPRFSEDLDFSLEKQNGYAPKEWMKKIKKDLQLSGFEAKVSWNDSSTVHKSWIKVPAF